MEGVYFRKDMSTPHEAVEQLWRHIQETSPVNFEVLWAFTRDNRLYFGINRDMADTLSQLKAQGRIRIDTQKGVVTVTPPIVRPVRTQVIRRG